MIIMAGGVKRDWFNFTGLSYLLWWKNSFKITAAKRIIAEFSGAKIISTFKPEIRKMLLKPASENSLWVKHIIQ